MASMDEQVLRAAKEIVVKFIEAGQISPSGFHEAFNSIYQTVSDAATEEAGKSEDLPDSKKEPLSIECSPFIFPMRCHHTLSPILEIRLI